MKYVYRLFSLVLLVSLFIYSQGQQTTPPPSPIITPSQANPQTNLQLTPPTTPTVGSQTNTQNNPSANSKAGPQTNAPVIPPANTQNGSQTNNQTAHQPNTKTNPQTNPTANPKTNPMIPGQANRPGNPQNNPSFNPNSRFPNSPQSNNTASDKPKLVIGIVVDQMRWDYLYRYFEKYTSMGFKRLLKEGYSCEDTHINYMPSYTAPGHTCIYTGSVPAIHGIAGNDWYDADKKAKTYCIEDSTEKLVGMGSLKGNVSPRHLLVTTITDELRLATNYQSKVVSLALKDRSAVLPGGHKPNGAYFFDGSSGNFVTSTYYGRQLPPWVTAFNAKKLAQKYIAQNWSTSLPVSQYSESTPDNEPYERAFKGETNPIFIHNLSKLAKDNPDIIASTPFGNSLTFDFAKAAIEGENMGKGKATDFLAISLSSTDLVGHQFGPNSVETEDTYLRLDKDLGDFLTYLDQKIGKGNYLVFLTADHGAAHSANYLKEKNFTAGSFPVDSIIKKLNSSLEKKFGKGEWVVSHENMQLYLNRSLTDNKKVKREEILQATRSFLMNFAAVADVVDLKNLAASTITADLKTQLTNGYNAKRSGDFEIIYNPGWFEDYEKGTTHGSPYDYDTHIPLVWMGWKIKHAEDHSDIHMTDIAPTIAALLHIQEPSGSIGKVISSLIDK